MQEKKFNLLYEPWIMVLNQEGNTEEVSLLTVFERAHEFQCLAGELPSQDVAVLRLLLAVLYATFTRVDLVGNRDPLTDAAQALERWKNLWLHKRFPTEAIKTRLCHYEEHFYLFHTERPFYQVPNLEKGTEYSAAKLLGNLSESGNKVRLFPIRSGIAKSSISYPEASRWLLYLNAFDDTSAKPSVRGQNMPSTGAGWLGKLGLVYAKGNNLFETLMLNFVLLNEKNEVWNTGNAVWELGKQRTKERTEIALPDDWFTMLTLQSRRVSLLEENNRVTGFRLLGGDFFPKENAFTEQMTMWRRDKKKDEYSPKRHDPAKQLWRNFSALFSEEEGDRKPGVVRWLSLLRERELIDNMVTLESAGVKYGDKDFFVTDIFHDSLTVNANIVSQLGEEWIIEIAKLLSLTQDCIKQLTYFASDLAKASGDSDSPNRRAGAGEIEKRRAEAYYRLDEPFRRWLVNIDPLKTDKNLVEQEWKDVLKRVVLQIGEDMANQAGENAIVGRWQGGRLYTTPGALVKFRQNLKRTIEKGG